MLTHHALKFIFPIFFLLFGWQTINAQIVTEPVIQVIKLKKGKAAIKKYHENGQISQTGWLKFNTPHGAWASFDEKGHILSQARYERGKKHGIWRFWDADGNLLCEIEYHYGTLVTARQYNVKGVIVASR